MTLLDILSRVVELERNLQEWHRFSMFTLRADQSQAFDLLMKGFVGLHHDIVILARKQEQSTLEDTADV